MKKFGQQIFYIFIVIVALAGITGGVILALGRINPPTKNSSANQDQNHSQENNSTTQENSKNSDDFLHAAEFKGGNFGKYYFLKDFSFSQESDFDKIEIDFLSRNNSSGVPYFVLRREDSFISLTFSDTLDFDLDRKESTFIGEKKQTVAGWIAQEITVSYPKDDSSIQIDIDCRGADFGYQVFEDNLKLTLFLK